MASDEASIERIVDAGDHIGETPVWSVAEQALYWINCENEPKLHRWEMRSGARKDWPMPIRVGGVALKRGGGLLVALADGLYNFDPADGVLHLRVASPVPPHVKLHECQMDRQGRFWIGAYDHHFTPTNRDSREAAYFRLDGDVLTPVIPDISVANGLAFSPDGRVMYASDSPTRVVDAYDLDPASGAVSGKRPFVSLELGEGYVDGAATDAEGCYWLAVVGAGQLRRYRPDGTLDRTIRLPCSNPTKPVFGGPDLDVIFVTSTRLPITLPGVEGAEHNGGLFAVRAGVKGLEDPLLAG